MHLFYLSFVPVLKWTTAFRFFNPNFVFAAPLICSEGTRLFLRPPPGWEGEAVIWDPPHPAPESMMYPLQQGQGLQMRGLGAILYPLPPLKSSFQAHNATPQPQHTI